MFDLDFILVCICKLYRHAYHEIGGRSNVWAGDELGWGLLRAPHTDIGTHLSQQGWMPRLSNWLAKQRSQLCWLKATQWYLITHTHTERGEFSVNCFEAIILIKRCRDQKEWRQSSVWLRGQTHLVVCHCAQTTVPVVETTLWCASVNNDS